ncbi:thioredoxin-like protein 1 [Lingula anatina]|uniref:Thioredoxin-like protein 1 n=1 Tax=Lingula anatina TaxID=7574 RepID=A0A1S3KGB9_LINAN|nr:thioredoxin-like protein 1 [Lingula anatina]|eukprot:XP_013421276.1 thioredoxin-like protein 1 [Lingula anatina]
MAGAVKQIQKDEDFQLELKNAGTKLVVVDFFATWCGPCRNIAPIVEQLAVKYPNAVFLKVDVDVCQETAARNGISAMPTFIFFKSQAKIDSQKGADPAGLEEKIKKWYGGDSENGEGEDTTVQGHIDLSSFFMKGGCECLNESDDHPFSDLLSGSGHLESDCDEQLIIAGEFSQPVKLHSFKLYGPPDKGPKNVKIFINQPKTMDFDSAESMEPVQSFELTPDDIKEGGIVNLRYVKYQNVQNLTIFIKDNQAGTEVTQVDAFTVYGTPVGKTDMAAFKRVAGKKGESH